MKAPRESDLVKQVLAWLTLHGIWCWRQNQGAIPLKGGGYRRFVGLPGVSDILAVLGPETGLPGVLLAIECKSPTGRLSPEQGRFLDEVNARGGIGLCVRSLADLEAGLRAEGVTFE